MTEQRERCEHGLEVCPGDCLMDTQYPGLAKPHHHNGSLCLLTALEEMEADNAALLQGLNDIYISTARTPNNVHEEIFSILSVSHPGAALLQRHAQELEAARTARQEEVDTGIKYVDDVHEQWDGLVAERDALQAELVRTRDALRGKAIWSNETDNGDLLGFRCRVCRTNWNVGQPESHNPVTLTINGVETNGPCPAKLPDHA